MDRIGDEDRRVIRDLPGQIVRKPRLQWREFVLHRLESLDRVRSGCLVNRNSRCGTTVEPGLAIEIGGAEFQTRDVAETQHRAVWVGADHDLLEFLRRGQPPLCLDVELQLLVVRDWPGADAPDGGL